MSRLIIGPAELRERLESGETAVLDTRDRDAYAAGHLPGAISLPGVYDYLVQDTGPAGMARLHAFLEELLGGAGLTGSEQGVFYEDGTGMRCTRGLWLLEYAGHSDAAGLPGGLQGWVRAGGELTQRPAVPAPASFRVRPRPELLATAEDVLARRGRTDTVLLDVRRREEYAGTFRQGCCPRSGRIPGAVWLEWDRL